METQAIPNGKGETAAIVTREVRLSDVALRLLSNVIDDLHVNASGAVFFSMLAVGVIWPEWSRSTSNARNFPSASSCDGSPRQPSLLTRRGR